MIFRLIKLFIWILLAGLIIFSLQYNSFKKEVLLEKSQVIIIDNWDTFTSIWKKIDWVNSFFLKYYLQNNTPNFELKAGRYQTPDSATISDIINSFQKPIYIQENVTLLEGWNIYDIDLYLNNKWVISKWDYISYVTNIEKIRALTEFFPFLEWLETLEGFLYPDTYKIDTQNFQINQFVITQLENFEKKVYDKVLSHLDNSTVQDVINLASIVEKEERNPKEKSTVAGILKKRLNEWWQIGADITVCYPFKLTSEECKVSVTKYLYEKNEYNTRQKFGLPKTPICNPTHETVYATLNDKETSYYYYLHDTQTGKIYYATTNAEHVRNKNLYLR